ncbi:MAG: CoA ester lyase [Methylobacteriaceae bacterium]|nr:CoA ester lyase [Methylobacteriaceae bacterium]
MGSHDPLIRSLLFVPGSRMDFLRKADAAGADAIVFDLEDAVAAAMKTSARASVRDALDQRGGRLTFVRINHPSLGMIGEDVSVLAPNAEQAVLVPKIEQVEDVLKVDAELAALEKRHGLPQHSISIGVAIESAAGLRSLHDVLRSTPRARGAVLASAEEGDLLADLGGRWTPTGDALAYSRGKFVCDARAAGVSWLIDGAFMNLRDEAALTREASLARTYGFTGKIAIHPGQVTAINAAFSPTSAEVDRARRLIDAFRAAEADGRGAVKFEGMMVDYANIKLAERILEMART